jgi:uncharacterized OB-fold protein/acyl dehydratase
VSEDKTDAEKGAFLQELRAFVGRSRKPWTARDPVGPALIRNWCDAMDDQNPVYTSAEDARESLHGELVAPPSMLSAWNMPGLVRHVGTPGDPFATVYARLQEAGFLGTVATNSEHEYARYLRVGDQLTATETVSAISDEKATGLGIGHFITTTTEYRNQTGERVGAMRWTMLLFKPGTGRFAMPDPGDAAAASGGGGPPARLRPGISRDTAFFWEGLKAGELRIQQCEACAALHHPPKVRCSDCGSYELGHRVASGKGVVYSHAEVHHPQVPIFDYPLVVALVELEEGTRLVTNIVAVDPDAVQIGMPVELCLDNADPELVLPMFRPARRPRRETTARFDEIEVGDALPPCPVPITPTQIVAGAIASRDFENVHHDRDQARKKGSPDIFMNILTTSGLCGRYVSDWAGPEALFRRLVIRLGVPNYPGDTMTFTGRVERKQLLDGRGEVELALRGANRLGDHVTGTVTVELPVDGGETR